MTIFVFDTEMPSPDHGGGTGGVVLPLEWSEEILGGELGEMGIEGRQKLYVRLLECKCNAMQCNNGRVIDR